MNKRDDKQLRSIGHKLKPVVTVAAKGLSESVLLEIERALSEHELIKIKLTVGDKQARLAVGEEICDNTGAQLIQSMGNIILVLRRSAQADPRLSNLIRH